MAMKPVLSYLASVLENRISYTPIINNVARVTNLCYRVLPDEFLLKLTLMTADFKRNSSGRTRRYEYSPPPQLTL